MGRAEHLPIATVALLALLLLAALSSPVARAAFPPVPVGVGGGFVTGLTAPVLAPGDGGTISFLLSDPLAADLTGVVITLETYRFNGYPGNATGAVPSGALALGVGGSWNSTPSLSLGTVVPGAPVPVTVPVASSSSAPPGTYAIRITVDFHANGTAYRLASRGAFSDATWSAATTGPNGTSTLNLSTLGVSGIVPETAVLLRSNPYPLALTVILGAAIVLAGVGGYYAFRRGPRSRSGATGPEDPSQAPTALGKSRKSDGD